MAAELRPPLGGRGVATVADEDVERFLSQGWTRVDGEASDLPAAQETGKVTETGGPEADDEDREFAATVVSDNLGDEDVLVTDFGRPGDEPVKGGTDRLRSAGDVDGETEAGVRPAGDDATGNTPEGDAAETEGDGADTTGDTPEGDAEATGDTPEPEAKPKAATTRKRS